MCVLNAIIFRVLDLPDKAKQLSVEEENQVNLAAYSKLEPLISELTGAHGLRMEAIGLAA